MDGWKDVRARLAAAGVAGADELGRFVFNTAFFEASTFDERAAMPILLEALPDLTEPGLVDAVAGHLRRPWARPAAFDALLLAFEGWARDDQPGPGWALGDALASAATIAHLETLLRLCRDREFGRSRQMLVFALSRFKRSPTVAPALIELLDDPAVALHAMGALRRSVGAREALPHLERIERDHRGAPLAVVAAREIKKAHKALGDG